MKKMICVLTVGLALSFVGCTTTQKWGTAGAVLGGAAGAVIGHQSGHGLEGAAIGAAAGGLGGAGAGHYKDKKDKE